MAESFLKRQDVGYPQIPNGRGIYAVKIIENADLDDLQVAVNTYLLALPATTNSWHPHVVSIQYDNFTTLQPPEVFHVCVITIFAVGTITSPPT